MPAHRYEGDTSRPDERSESQADTRLLFTTSQGKNFYVYERDGASGEVWIDVSRLDQGDGGGGIYAAIGDYAHNTGKTFIGDPYGLSEDAVIRRTSHMLSQIVRHGTADHIAPAPAQISGIPEKGIAALEWSGNDAEKFYALAQSFLDTLAARIPRFAEYSYDFNTGAFLDPRGRPIGRDRMRDAGNLRFPKAARAGSATLRRGILLQSLVAGETAEKSRLVQDLLSRKGAIDANLNRLFSNPATLEAPLAADAAPTLTVQQIAGLSRRYNQLTALQRDGQRLTEGQQRALDIEVKTGVMFGWGLAPQPVGEVFRNLTLPNVFRLRSIPRIGGAVHHAGSVEHFESDDPAILTEIGDCAGPDFVALADAGFAEGNRERVGLLVVFDFHAPTVSRWMGGSGFPRSSRDRAFRCQQKNPVGLQHSW